MTKEGRKGRKQEGKNGKKEWRNQGRNEERKEGSEQRRTGARGACLKADSLPPTFDGVYPKTHFYWLMLGVTYNQGSLITKYCNERSIRNITNQRNARMNL